jgi:hypothetical protein
MNEQLDRIERKLLEVEGKVDAAYQSSEKMRKYFLWTGVIAVGAILVPLLILPLFLPSFFASQGIGTMGGL